MHLVSGRSLFDRCFWANRPLAEMAATPVEKEVRELYLPR